MKLEKATTDEIKAEQQSHKEEKNKEKEDLDYCSNIGAFGKDVVKIENKLEEYKNLTINFTKEAPAEEYYQSIALTNKEEE